MSEAKIRLGQVTTLETQLNTIYGQANSAYTAANGSQNSSNTVYADANTANTTAKNAYAQANLAYTAANSAQTYGNTLSTSVNSTVATINTNYQAAYADANTANTAAKNAYAQANLAYTAANSAQTYGNTLSTSVNSTVATINTNYQAAYAAANTGATNALNAYAQANSAYTTANNALPKAGGTMTGNLIMSAATVNTSIANISTVITGNALSIGTGIGSNSNVTISANGTEYLRLTNTGNVGIGTATPSTILQVQGSLAAATSLAALKLLSLRNSSDGGVGINFRNSVSDPLASIDALVTSTGAGTDDGILAFSTATNAVNTERMRIDSSGNVGIGNTAPTQKLQVSGNVLISGLTSVASVAEWCTGGYAINNVTITFNITVQNDDGQGVPHHVQAAHTHYNFSSYGCVLDTWIATRNTTIVQQNDLLNITSVGGGAWTATKTSDTNLRVSKSAGTYPGAGWYWIKVTTFSTI